MAADRFLFRQRSLFHVLHCFSTYCSECGYCQGMGPIAATLLCYFDPAVCRLFLFADSLTDPTPSASIRSVSASA